MRQNGMFVNVMSNVSRRLYVAVTNDLAHRLWEHLYGRKFGFTRRYGITRLVYFEQLMEPLTAIAREKTHQGLGAGQETGVGRGIPSG